MLVATRDDGPHAHAVHYGPHVPPRTLASRFTGAVQLVGSLVGIPLALIGGYSTYHATFSPEGRCQALRANIVSMLDKKTDATTLRLLVQKDVFTFEQECSAVDSDAAAAFRNLIASEKPAVAHRVVPPAKVEKTEKVERVQAVMAQPPAKADKAEKAEKIEKAEKREPLKREAVKQEASTKEVSAKEAPAKEAVTKLEAPKQLGAPPHPLVAPPPAAEQAATSLPQAEKQAGKVVEEAKPVEAATAAPEKERVDATWVASVRDALRESASKQPAAETTTEVAAPNLGAPINIAPEPQVASGTAAGRTGLFTPPGDVGPDGSRPVAPRPPAPIPNAN
jgi:hypothetical protein